MKTNVAISAFIFFNCALCVMDMAMAEDKSVGGCKGRFSANSDLLKNTVLGTNKKLPRKTQLTSKRIRLLFSNPDEIIKYVDQKGYIFFSKNYYDGDMKKAYGYVLAALGKKKFQYLKWKVFYGTVDQFEKLQDLLLIKKQTNFVNKDIDSAQYIHFGVIKKEFIGMEGLILLADKLFVSRMGVTFDNAFAVLNPYEFAQLKWWRSSKNTKEFIQIKIN